MCKIGVKRKRLSQDTPSNCFVVEAADLLARFRESTAPSKMSNQARSRTAHKHLQTQGRQLSMRGHKETFFDACTISWCKSVMIAPCRSISYTGSTYRWSYFVLPTANKTAVQRQTESTEFLCALATQEKRPNLCVSLKTGLPSAPPG